MSGSRPLAVVTGGRGGIGAAAAACLAAHGFDVAIADIERTGYEAVLAAVESHGSNARLFEFDLADIGHHQDAISRMAAWGGPVACLVNNAGMPAHRRGDLLEMAPESFDRVLDVNLRGTFFFTQAVARHMIATPAAVQRSIITVSSVSAAMASIERGEYCISKAGLGMLTKLFALRLAADGIGVFEVRPGIIRTPMTEAAATRYDGLIAGGLVPSRRWGEPEDVARAIAALASGSLGFATGSVLHVDGALSVPRL